MKKLTKKFTNLSLKERVGIVLASAVVSYAIWDFALMQPMLEKERKISNILEQKQQQVTLLSEQLEVLNNDNEERLDKKNRQRLESVIKQLQVTDQRLLEITSNLIAPDQMASVLEALLASSEGLKIRSLLGLGATPFPEKKMVMHSNLDIESAEKKSEANKKPETKAWRHGLRVEFSGSYLDTLKYLQMLEGMDWRFYWESVEIDAEAYPTVKTAIKVYTLSLDKKWIGV